MQYLILILILIFLYYFFKQYVNPKRFKDVSIEKGKVGESSVNQTLSSLHVQDYILVPNVIIKKADGSSNQIDHLVLSKYGIFVIETKNYNGVIIGRENDYKWQQVFNKRKKYLHLNPIIQNKGHLDALKQLLPVYADDIYHSIIVFTGDANIDNLYVKTPVVPLEMLLDTIYGYNSVVLNENDINNIYTIISSTKYMNELSENDHINYVKSLGYNDSGYNQALQDLKPKHKSRGYYLVRKKVFSLFVFICFIILMSFYSRYNQISNPKDSMNNNTVTPAPTFINSTSNQTTKSQSYSEIIFDDSQMNNNEADNNIQITPESDENMALEETENDTLNLSEFESNDNTIKDNLIDVSKFTLINNSLKGYTLTFSLKNNSDYILQLREDSQVIVNLNNGDTMVYDMFGSRLTYSEQQLINPSQESGFVPFEINDVNAEITSIDLINNDLVDKNDTNKIIKKNYIISLKIPSNNDTVSDTDLSDKIQFSDLSFTSDLNNKNKLSFSIINNSDYILQLRENSQIAIILNNGDITKYDIFGDRLPYNITQRLNPGSVSPFVPFDIKDINSTEIKEINLANIDLIDVNDNSIIIYNDYLVEWMK